MTHSTTPAVSILTPMKNAAPWVAETIASVRAQTFQDWEMHIIDDGSTDNSLGVAQAAAQSDARILIGPNTTGVHGAAGARNAGLAMARGRYIAFLDADDLWDPAKLDLQIKAMQIHNWVFSWTSYRIESEANRGVDPDALPVRCAQIKATRQDILSKKAPIGCLTAVYDTQAFGKVPMVNIPKRQDFVLWATLMLTVEENGWHSGGIPDPLATHRFVPGSLSRNKLRAAAMQWRALVGHCGVRHTQAASLFAAYAVRGLWDRVKTTRTKEGKGMPPKV